MVRDRERGLKEDLLSHCLTGARPGAESNFWSRRTQTVITNFQSELMLVIRKNVSLIAYDPQLY